MKLKVGCGFEALGIAEPGPSMEEIMNTVSKDIGGLNIKVLWYCG
jgi:hypothetical protein